MTEHDVIVIGLGPGGEEAAGILAEAGLEVLGVERHLVGGECPYWGCIPSKAMVRAADSLGEAARVTKLAGDVKISPEWQPLARRVREVTADWDDAKAVERLERKGGTFLRGSARITGPRAVEIEGRPFSARRAILLATGTEPAVPPIDGLKDVDYWTNRDAIEAEELPRSLIILGAGPIGLELGQVFRRFGSQVKVVELAERALPNDEPEIGAAVAEVLAEEGIDLHTGVGAEKVAAVDGGIEVTLGDGRKVSAERILVAVGRKPNLPDVGLEKLGLDPDAKALAVDEHMSAGDGLWAVGDITGKGQFTHVAVYQARIAAASILGKNHASADYRAVPRVTFMDPEVASVGLSEERARAEGIDVRAAISETKSSARGWIHGPGAEHGVFKVVVDAERDVLVGASVMSPAAGEIIGFLALAIKEETPIAHLRDLIYPYPTFIRTLEPLFSYKEDG